MTYFILGWLAGLSVSMVVIYLQTVHTFRAGNTQPLMGTFTHPAHRPGGGGAAFITSNRVEEIIKGSDKPVSLSDVLV